LETGLLSIYSISAYSYKWLCISYFYNKRWNKVNLFLSELYVVSISYLVELVE
jgi:hypothetical protein